MRKPGTWDYVKVEFDVCLISSTIELTRIQVSDQLCTLLCMEMLCLFVMVSHSNNQEITVQGNEYED